MKKYPTPWQRKMMWASLSAVFVVVLILIVGTVVYLGANLIAFLQPILIPVAIAAILAYLLDPVVTHLAATGRVGAGSGRAGPHAGAKAHLGDVGIAGAIDENLARPGYIGPLGEVPPLRCEQLNAAILAVSDIDRPVPIDRDAVRQMKLTWPTPRLTPRC